jgi:hypothetical protein
VGYGILLLQEQAIVRVLLALLRLGPFFFFSSLLEQKYRARVALGELGFACLLLLKQQQQQHAWCVCSKLYDALFYFIIKLQFVNE